MEYTYSAFISYRHLPEDIAAAKAVQRALETYRIPADIRKKTGVRRLKRCFRDQDELPLADDLGSSIEKALQQSEWLVVVCSPSLPGSNWCLREIDYFIGLGRKDHIIPVLISGEPADSYPPQITREDTENESREVEPLAADLRGSLRRQLKSEKLRIAARMLNVNYNDLKKREKEQALRRSLAVVSCVLAAALGFTAYALRQNALLAEERSAAARSATELLIEKSVRSTAEGDLGSGLSYALRAYDGSRLFGTEYDSGVSAAFEAAMYPDLYQQIGRLKDNGVVHGSAELSNDGRLVAFRQADLSLPVFSTVTGEKLYSIRNFGRYWSSAFSPDGRYICRCFPGSADFVLFSAADGTEVLNAALPDGWVVAASRLTADSRIPVLDTAGRTAALYDPFAGKLSVLEGIVLPDTPFSGAVIHRSGLRGAWTDGERIWLADLESGKILRSFEGSLFSIFGDAPDEGPFLRYSLGNANVFLRWDTAEEVLRSGSGSVLSPDGKLLADARGYSGFTVYDAASGEILWEEGFNDSNTVYSVAFADSDTLIASHGQVQVYRVSTRELVYDSGESRASYGYDIAAGRLVMPLRSGGCLISLMPSEEDVLPHKVVESRPSYNPDDIWTTTLYYPLLGNWNGSTFGYFDENGRMVTADTDEPGLFYSFGGETYVIHPVNGIMANFIYISPDGEWQALIRGQDVDIFRAKESPEPVMTIPGTNFDRLCAAIYGNVLVLGSYVENLSLYDLTTGECIGTLDTGAMCQLIQFSRDGRQIITLSGLAKQAAVISMENFAVVMKIPVPDSLYGVNGFTVGFNKEGTEAVVLHPDGHADVGLLVTDLDSLVEKARRYTSAD